MAKILIVDDEIGIRELLSEILDEEGYTVYAAENAEAARVLMSQEQFDLILLDIWMPDTDGITLLKEWGVRKMLNCPVIMMSGICMPRLFIHLSRSMPSWSGSLKSDRIKSGAWLSSCLRARAMLLAVETSNPFLPSHVFSMMANVMSSSIINIDLIVSGFSLFYRAKVTDFERKSYLCQPK